VSGSGLVGFVAHADADVQLQYTYYRATNNDSVFAPLTQPYGAIAAESVFTVGVKYKISKTLVLNAKFGYADSTNDTTGGFTNYHGPLAFISFEHAL
jgi:hypothetical protein